MDDTAISGAASLQLLKPGSTRAALFIAHGMGGEVGELAELARHIGGDRAVYAIRARGLDGDCEPRNRVQSMAADYLALIRGVQPHGPYLLGGFSFGGLIALEMAQRLTDSGGAVGGLVLIDTFRHSQHRPLRARLAVLVKFSLRRLNALRRGSPSELLKYVIRKSSGLSSPNSAAAQREWFVDKSAPAALQRVRSCNYDAWCEYQPQRYAAPVDFFRAQINIGAPHNPLWDWGAVLTDVRIHTLRCDHLDLIGSRAPALAQAVSNCLANRG
jgi:acetoacetyl-CoA synthetase